MMIGQIWLGTNILLFFFFFVGGAEGEYITSMELKGQKKD